ncbi:MAG: hypothetical protein A2275_18190 [Bacteroidetes bacterium RIFOXYA12_FULL_35_11]|nr:MAG: hypothetical protein A2X01_20755 [Bacteroidetes bacterium GWF2_35_48]OFY82692.1 MAG: hypothetical protein A2275_18190 [Bacteroidetes bacterium RIFOXYA12_FULL_35_11]OFY95023.1 MAG: hypothetical protein A2491_16690 [Bacteroidetes bacterium RIFOXYC12_FULL_35_7]OFY95346.1 MAG: hypothetical protein A2309_06445 [Bacteroidetes bacterium RIFOXYB2_FULL_35_7]HBX51794.1 hypothetical protein [Bacteroidales bacterium]
MRIIWSEPAIADYWQNIDYLLKEWGDSVAIDFIDKVDQVLILIATKPATFQKTNFKNTRQIPIVPQVTLFYQFSNDTVELVRFWNNYQNPEKLKL